MHRLSLIKTLNSGALWLKLEKRHDQRRLSQNKPGDWLLQLLQENTTEDSWAPGWASCESVKELFQHMLANDVSTSFIGSARRKSLMIFAFPLNRPFGKMK